MSNDEAASKDEAGSPASSNGSDMGMAAHRLNKQLTDQNRARLNEISAAVFESHALQPVAAVLAALIAKSQPLSEKPDIEALNAAAHAISRGSRFAFV
jgi:hypothetical protein